MLVTRQHYRLALASVVTLVAAVFAGISVAALVICACRRHNRRSSEPKRQKPSDGAVEPLVHPEMAPAAPTGTSDRPPARPRTLILGSSGGTESHTADVPAVMSTAHRSHADGPSPVCCTPSAKPATSHGSGRCSRHSSSSSASNVNLHNSHRMPDNCVEGVRAYCGSEHSFRSAPPR